MKINFECVRFYTDIAHKSSFEEDVKERFADVLYKHGNGIRAHALALKIFNSKGETEFSNDEVAMIMEIANDFCTPNFIEALQDIVEPNASIAEKPVGE